MILLRLVLFSLLFLPIPFLPIILLVILVLACSAGRLCRAVHVHTAGFGRWGAPHSCLVILLHI
jgi:hypothetical protein